MLTDKGFSHAIARAALKDDPDNAEALKMLQEPENKIVIVDSASDRIIIDLDSSDVNEFDVRRKELSKQVNRFRSR